MLRKSKEEGIERGRDSAKPWALLEKKEAGKPLGIQWGEMGESGELAWMRKEAPGLPRTPGNDVLLS